LRHTIHTEIKAITYHQLRVREEGGLWRTTVIVDV
jgi:SHS2 domain-containing protein